ncbi:hypothetical protein PI23P_06555 [Polaribacter irgensii 23-P]|uniref:Polysaccharide pyruvyl transferase domain-containing protein n=1 Tax=Polaribacter irgensii 23-P TaxID=313594 RepID=A4BYM0_9FLAO|nr:polysaccharide pyruvyl transferase family protein [Polaribacter irgensii]EAR12263.1 hypothetical protein PI23P_06555 [Polaribacter irgensii 23-P]
MCKKIGILTFPTVVNHGAYLQVFALWKHLQNEGHSVEVINYRNEIHLKNEYKALFVKKNVSNIPINIRRFFKFKKAQKRFGMKKLTTKVGNLDKSDFDIVIVGADIVWNYSTPFVGHDPIYFGKGLEDKNLISYAASMGNSDVNKQIPIYVMEGLETFSCISVRDQNSSTILKKVKFESEIVLDPCLIFDYTAFEIIPKIEDKYILVYAFEHTEKDISEIVKFSKANSLKIISIGFNKKYSWSDENIMVLDPLEFLGYYSNASYVFTSTFHGTLFAIKYNKKFAVRMNFTIERKVNTILKELKLEGQVINASLIDCWNNEIDYSFANKIMNKKISDSKSFLERSLKIV